MSEDLTTKLPQSADEKLTLILTTVQSLTVRVDSIDSRLQHVDSRLQHVDSRLQRVEETIDDARPVWQLLITDVAHLREGQLLLERGQRRLEEGEKSLRADLTAFRQHVDQQFLTLSGTVEGRYREHDRRIARLETNSNLPNAET